ncbi:MAG: VanW family protein [Clostridia bacterium]|nr:VanW family protein [Clostridia bacterium]
MKDYAKRIVIVFILLVAVIFILDFAYTKYQVNNETQNPNVPVENVGDDEIIPWEPLADTDVIETFENALGRCTANLNFRDYPSTDGKIIQTMPKNTVIDVLAKVRSGWYKVSYNDVEGYVSNEYLSILSEEEKKEITVAEEYINTFAKVNIDTTLNIRSRANKEATRLTSVKAGSVLKVIKRMENNWYYVEGNAIEGYVSGEYIKILTKEEYSTYSSQTNNLLNPAENIIATYTSTSSYNQNSRYNMHLAADYENGTIVAPGETYSHLNVVHPEGELNKYVESTIFTGDGKTAQASGGGICQTSSTTFAAIASAEEKGIKTGLNVTAQAPHSGKVNYVPRKFEATVSSGSQDFCFRNCNDYSVKIVTSYNYNTLTVTIYKI